MHTVYIVDLTVCGMLSHLFLFNAGRVTASIFFRKLHKRQGDPLTFFGQAICFSKPGYVLATRRPFVMFVYRNCLKYEQFIMCNCSIFYGFAISAANIFKSPFCFHCVCCCV